MILPCGHQAEDDGDRYYTDHCWECGWRSESRKESDKRTAEKLAKVRERAPLTDSLNLPLRQF